MVKSDVLTLFPGYVIESQWDLFNIFSHLLPIYILKTMICINFLNLNERIFVSSMTTFETA